MRRFEEYADYPKVTALTHSSGRLFLVYNVVNDVVYLLCQDPDNRYNLHLFNLKVRSLLTRAKLLLYYHYGPGRCSAYWGKKPPIDRPPCCLR